MEHIFRKKIQDCSSDLIIDETDYEVMIPPVIDSLDSAQRKRYFRQFEMNKNAKYPL